MTYMFLLELFIQKEYAALNTQNKIELLNFARACDKSLSNLAY